MGPAFYLYQFCVGALEKPQKCRTPYLYTQDVSATDWRPTRATICPIFTGDCRLCCIDLLSWNQTILSVRFVNKKLRGRKGACGNICNAQIWGIGGYNPDSDTDGRQKEGYVIATRWTTEKMALFLELTSMMTSGTTQRIEIRKILKFQLKTRAGQATYSPAIVYALLLLYSGFHKNYNKSKLCSHLTLAELLRQCMCYDYLLRLLGTATMPIANQHTVSTADLLYYCKRSTRAYIGRNLRICSIWQIALLVLNSVLALAFCAK